MLLFNGHKIPIGKFPNGEVNIDKPFFGKVEEDVENVVTLKYEGDEDLFRLLLVRKALWFPCDLHITYFPYSRMDRNSDEYIFTLKSVAKFINWMEWDHVVIYEPHSDVTPALLNKCMVVDVIPHLLRMITDRNHYQLFYPDAGAQKRYNFYSPYSTLLGLKTRDFKTGRITSQQVIGTKETDTVVIVDDLCSKGGTFVLAAEKLKEMGFKTIFLVVAHCEKTIFEGKIFSSGLFDKIITTDSILDTNEGHENLRVLALQGGSQ